MGLFAYGTLMTAEGMRSVLGDRVEAFRFRPARLPGWRRIWNTYREEWLGGGLNVEPHPDSSVVGVLIEGWIKSIPDLRKVGGRGVEP